MDLSSYRISEKTVEKVARVAVLSVPGIRDIDAKLAGLAGRSFPRVDALIDRGTGSVSLQVEIVTTYPAPVGAITDEIRQTVGTHVETLTGLVVSRVNIAVADAEASAPGVRVTREDIAAHPVGVDPTPITVSPSAVHSPVVEEPIELADIEVDDSRYEHIVSVSAPQPPRVEHVPKPAPPRAWPVSAPEPVRPQSVYAPDPAPLRRITIQRFAESKPVTIEPGQPVRAVFAPDPQPLRSITVNRRGALEPVSLPPRKPLEPIYAPRPQVVQATRPVPEPLRQVTFTPTEVFVPTVPQQEPLSPITVHEDNVDKQSDGEHKNSKEVQ